VVIEVELAEIGKPIVKYCLADDATVRDLLRSANRTLSSEESILINDSEATESDRLHQGDRVLIVPEATGGNPTSPSFSAKLEEMRRKKRLEKIDVIIHDIGSNLKVIESTIVRTKKAIVELTHLLEEPQRKLEDEILRISKFTKIETVSFDKDFLEIETKPLILHYEGQEFLIGRYTFTYNGETMQVFSEEWTSLDHQHPNLSNSNLLCFGDTPAYDLLQEGRLSDFIAMALRVLEYPVAGYVAIDEWLEDAGLLE